MLNWLRKKRGADTPPAPAASTMEMLISPVRTRDEFVLLYSKLIEERRPGVKLVLTGPTVIEMTMEGDKRATTFLDNLWIQLQRAEDRRELVEKHVNAMLSMLDPRPAVDKKHIIPIVKDAEYVQSFGQITVFEHFVADMYCVYAIDWEDRTESLSRTIMESLGLEQTTLRNFAVENLKAILPPVECHGDGPWFLLSAGTDYVASLLFFDDLWDQLTEMVQGDPIAVVPARDVLLFTGAASNEGITAIRCKAEEIVSRGDHVVSSTLLRRSGGKWIAFS